MCFIRVVVSFINSFDVFWYVDEAFVTDLELFFLTVDSTENRTLGAGAQMRTRDVSTTCAIMRGVQSVNMPSCAHVLAHFAFRITWYELI